MKRVEEGAKAEPKAKRASRASGARKSAVKAKKTANAATKAKLLPKTGAKAKQGASEAKPIKVRKSEKVAVVLSGEGADEVFAGGAGHPKIGDDAVEFFFRRVRDRFVGRELIVATTSSSELFGGQRPSVLRAK